MRPQKKTHRHKGSKKSGLGKGWCGKFEKKIDEHINGCGILAYRVPRFPLFPPSTLHWTTNNSFIWISQSCGKKKMGTTAGTRVLCTQYLLRVATDFPVWMPYCCLSMIFNSVACFQARSAGFLESAFVRQSFCSTLDQFEYCFPG